MQTKERVHSSKEFFEALGKQTIDEIVDLIYNGTVYRVVYMGSFPNEKENND